MQKRLDMLLSEKENISRTRAQNLIEEGLVFVEGNQIKKPSTLVGDDKNVVIEAHDDYVSRGAYKLVGAVKSFGVDLKDKIVLDLGASTGGFTQVCLKNGAKKVYAVDVGKDQLDKKLICDVRVVNLQNTDVRSLTKELVGDANFIVGDLSFISLTKVFPKIKELFGVKIHMILLFKPQFECGKEIAKKYRGIIKNKEIHIKLLENFENFAKLLGFLISDIVISPIKGGDGNTEYLLLFNGVNKNYCIDEVVNKQ